MINYHIGSPLYANNHKMEINKNIVSPLSGKKQLSIDDGKTSEMLNAFLFSSSVFILQVRCKLETSITNMRHKKVRFQPGVETA